MTVFGSEEYNEWVNSPFDDGMAVFISGPNPSGGYYDWYNMAQVPDSNLPIRVSNINNGYVTSGSFANGPCFNCEFYIDNLYGQYLEYDGYTLPIVNYLPVVKDSVYRVRIVIADARDAIYDSGIFLGKNSFRSIDNADFLEYWFLPENNSGIQFPSYGQFYGDSIVVVLPDGTSLDSLVATFKLNEGATTNIGGVQQFSDSSINDFNTPVIYEVVCSSGSTKIWKVYVINEMNSIKTYNFLAQDNDDLYFDAVSTITSDDSIDIVLPHYTNNLTALVARFTTSSYSWISIDEVVQQSGTTPNNFNQQVNCIVNSIHGAQRNYTIHVNQPGGNQTEFSAYFFHLVHNPSLNQTVYGEIGNDSIDLVVPAGTNVNELIATFVLGNHTICFVNDIFQENNVTPNNFQDPVTYQVLAGGGYTKDWIVSVHQLINVETVAKNRIVLYPNPARDRITINVEINTMLKVFNSNGEIMNSMITKSDLTPINVSLYPNGHYYLKTEKDGSLSYSKFIIAK